MAYQTGFVSTASGLLTNINSFLLGIGWTLHNALDTEDLVYRSSGSSGDEEIYIRLRTGVKDYDGIPGHNAWQNQDYAAAKFEHINVSVIQGHNANTSTSYNECDGRIGPLLFGFFNPNNISTNATLQYYLYPELNQYSYTASKWTGADAFWYSPGFHGGLAWGNDRRFYGLQPSNAWYRHDPVTHSVVNVGTQQWSGPVIFAYDDLVDAVR